MACHVCVFVQPRAAPHLLQLLLCILLPAQLILSALPQLSQPMRLLLGDADLVLQLLLQVHLLHLHGAMLFLGLLQPAGQGDGSREEQGAPCTRALGGRAIGPLLFTLRQRPPQLEG